MSRQRPDPEPGRGTWPDPKEPPLSARAFILAVMGLAAMGIALYGAATTDPGEDGFLLFLGAAVVGLAVAIRQVASLLADRRSHRDR